MDNLTHSLIGLAAAKAGLEKLSPGTTTLCVLAANAPDGDILALLVGGRWAYLQHHRGITHSIIGCLALAVALPLVFYFGDRLVARVRQREVKLKLKGLLLASLLVTATHPIMDWTNNYGMRFLLPWNPRWFYGDFVFIIDPFIWLVLGGAAFLLTSKTRKHIIVWVVISLVPSLIVLVGRSGTLTTEMSLRLVWIAALIVLVILYRRKIVERHGSNIAIAALVLVTFYCTGLAATHALALRQAKLEAASIANTKHEQIVKVAAMPTMANPVDWLCVMETDRAIYKFNTSLLHRTVGPSDVIRYEKPFGPAAEAVAQAERDGRAEIFLGFARFPVVRVVGDDCLTQTLVQFADLRYTEPGKGRGTFSLDVPVECAGLDKQAR
jgi:inner membrane protein